VDNDRQLADMEGDEDCVDASCDTSCVILLGMVGCALMLGDGVITPAISVLSALRLLPPGLVSQTWQIVLAIVVLVCLFAVQRHGSALIGAVAGPVMVAWFLLIGAFGTYNLITVDEIIVREIIVSLNPACLLDFWTTGRFTGVYAWRALAGVVLCVTGAEALYSDMGHFGAKPISCAWLFLVYPSLVLQYMGQSVALMLNPEGISNPFASALPQSARGPMTLLAVLAAILASQSLISSVFSLVSQAHAVGFVPRIRVVHTNPDQYGQVFIPEINWVLCTLCVLMCVVFQTSTAMAGAYGITVTGTFIITTMLLYVVLRRVWHWRAGSAFLVIAPMLIVDGLFWSSNMAKVFSSGWVPVLIAFTAWLLMHARHWGRNKQRRAFTLEAEQAAGTIDDLALLPLTAIRTVPALQAVLQTGRLQRTNTVAVFLTSHEGQVPQSLGTLAASLGSLPGTIILLHIAFDEAPFVAQRDRASFKALGQRGLFSAVLQFGYAEPLTAERFDVNATLGRVASEQAGTYPALMALEQPGSVQSAVTYVFTKRQYAVKPGHSSWTWLRIALHDYLERIARTPTHFYGLESQNTMEVSVMCLL